MITRDHRGGREGSGQGPRPPPAPPRDPPACDPSLRSRDRGSAGGCGGGGADGVARVAAPAWGPVARSGTTADMRARGALLVLAGLGLAQAAFRPPAVPLVVQSPYVSVWSPADALYDADAMHWAGATNAMAGFVVHEGTCYRWLGAQRTSTPPGCAAALTQTDLVVDATTTTYSFRMGNTGDAELRATFRTPAGGAIANGKADLDVLALPATWLEVQVVGTSTPVHVYFDVAADIAVADPATNVSWARAPGPAPTLGTRLRIGATQQTFNQNAGNDRVSWGHLHVLADANADATAAGVEACRTAFAQGKPLPPLDERDMAPSGASNGTDPVLAVAMQLAPEAPRTITLLYDIGIAMEYFGTPLAPLYRGTDTDLSADASDKHAHALLATLAVKRKALAQACDEADASTTDSLRKVGGTEYAMLGSLSYRQVLGACAVVYNPILHTPWVFIKEISSDGDVSTVDVIYPASPFFVYAAPDLLRVLLIPVLAYADNATAAYGPGGYEYTKPFAPHHLGHWPVCDILSSQQEDMPMEESANMLIMLAAIAKAGSSVSFLSPYGPLLKSWAEFLNATLPDPGNQLCTDDFEGPSPHNANLAAKGILGLGAYAQLLEALGDRAGASAYRTWAKAFAADWSALASTKPSYPVPHTKLEYDLGDDTWSQKYNLLWDRALNMEIFPASVFDREVAFYETMLNTYGVPLDNRATFTKLDWSMWIATFDDAFFAKMTAAVFRFANTTIDRRALSDWYQTDSARMVGFTARPVVGGVFAKMLV